MAGDQFLGQELIGGTSGQHADQPPARGHDQGDRSRDGEQAPGMHARRAIRAARPAHGRLDATAPGPEVPENRASCPGSRPVPPGDSRGPRSRALLEVLFDSRLFIRSSSPST